MTITHHIKNRTEIMRKTLVKMIEIKTEVARLQF